MKKLIYYCFLMVSMSTLFVACQPDEDEDPVVTGDIEGSWRSQENSATYGPSNYYVDISVDSANSSLVKIDNFFNMGLGKKMSATKSGNTILLSSDVFEGFVFSGTGTIASNFKSISWSYTFDDGNGAESVTGTYTKL